MNADTNSRAYQNELDNIAKDLADLVDNMSLDPLIKHAITYAYALGKADGYVAGVQAMAGEER
jgi:hypothetical protein